MEQETQSVNEPQGKQQPIETQPGSNREGNSDHDTMNNSELVSNNHYLSTDPVTVDDKAILTDNRSPSPFSPENSTGPGSIHQKSHQELVLKVSEGSHVSVPIDGDHRPVRRVKSVVTPGGRVVRNTKMNNSVKYNIDGAKKKYPSDFSNYGNLFRSASSVKKGEGHEPSLRRDGQKRRISSKERTDSNRSLSTSSDDVFINGKKNSKFVHQGSTVSCTSVTSNSPLTSNPYNDVNQKCSSIVWCPCFFFFCFGCCLPAIYFMNRSDILYNDGDYNKAQTYARVSTALYILGMIISIAFWSAIFAVILIYAT